MCADVVKGLNDKSEVWVNQKVPHDKVQGCWYLKCVGLLVLHQPNPSDMGSARVRLYLVASCPWTMIKRTTGCL